MGIRKDPSANEVDIQHNYIIVMGTNIWYWYITPTKCWYYPIVIMCRYPTVI